MKAFEPENGLIVRYDYLWRTDASKGLEHGLKDRPAAVILVVPATETAGRRVLLCAISRSEPARGCGIPLPPELRTRLGLDAAPSWIVTTEYNELPWDTGVIPYGISPASRTRDVFGFLTPGLFRRVRDQLAANRKTGTLKRVPRN